MSEKETSWVIEVPNPSELVFLDTGRSVSQRFALFCIDALLKELDRRYPQPQEPPGG